MEGLYPSDTVFKKEKTMRDVSKDLLLAIDFQNVYLPGNDWACPGSVDAITNTLRILNAKNAPDALITKYLAPEHPVGRWINYNQEYKDINDNAFYSELEARIGALADRIPVISKDTYSSLKNEQVLSALKDKEAVVLTGVVAECCVLATMLDAIDLGYQVIYLYDCVAGQTPHKEACARQIAEDFAPVHTLVMSCGEYLKEIG